MKMIDVNGKMVNADIRPSKYPLKPKSRSSLQGKTQEFLVEKYPAEVILEDFTLPGSRLSVDFLIWSRGIAVEVQGRQHTEHNDFFHGSHENKNFFKQVNRDLRKLNWCESNGLELIEIFTEKDLENWNF